MCRHHKILEELEHRITVLVTLSMEIEMIVIDSITTSQQAGVHHDDLLALIKSFLEALAPPYKVEDDNIATQVVLL